MAPTGRRRPTLAGVATVAFRGDEARHLRWAGGAMLAAGLVLSRLPAGTGLPCPLRTLTGVPCPLCGMQTSVEATLAGHLGRAVAANPAGLVAVVLAVVLLVTRPATIRRPPLPLVITLLAAMWAFELVRFGILPGFG
ncbi:MAG: hypothetical protein QOI99_139 [Actinomycetota bacterium]|nr:hypothetical protein [Actinomycetota bacterium]